jgi:hypothetical protein
MFPLVSLNTKFIPHLTGEKAMNKLVAALCVLLGIGTMSVQADELYSYTAKLNEEGKYCARIQYVGVNNLPVSRTKCRTLDEWYARGYLITQVGEPTPTLENFENGGW